MDDSGLLFYSRERRWRYEINGAEKEKHMAKNIATQNEKERKRKMIEFTLSEDLTEKLQKIAEMNSEKIKPLDAAGTYFIGRVDIRGKRNNADDHFAGTFNGHTKEYEGLRYLSVYDYPDKEEPMIIPIIGIHNADALGSMLAITIAANQGFDISECAYIRGISG